MSHVSFLFIPCPEAELVACPCLSTSIWTWQRWRTPRGQTGVSTAPSHTLIPGDKGIKIGEGTYANVYKGTLFL
jgi:hypothetical protein